MDTTGSGRRRPPIGYVLRELDRLIEERFEHTLGRRGITRRQWQILNVLADNGSSFRALTEAVAPFLDQGAGETIQSHVDPLTRRGLIHHDDGVLTLTDTGRALLESLTTDVQAIRELTTTGLGEHQYDQTIATLELMIDNLRPA